jgi:hypothetical protein
MREKGLAVELLETRHGRTAFKTMPVKTDRKDASAGRSIRVPLVLVRVSSRLRNEEEARNALGLFVRL